MPTVGFKMNNASVVEGNSGATKFNFLVELSAPSTTSVTVNYTTDGTYTFGTATRYEDYTPVTSQVTFAPGETSKTISIDVIGDIKYEASEYFYLELTSATGADVVTNGAEGLRNSWVMATIVNDDLSALTIIGTSGNDVLTGDASNNYIAGDDGSDTIAGGTGNDALDGGLGTDTAVFSGTRSSHSVTQTSSGWTVSSGPDGTDTIQNIERLQFSDETLALDLAPSEHGGQALEFVGVLAPGLISSPSIVGLILGLFDQGSSLHDVFQLALDIGLVTSIAGSDTDRAIAAMAYRNLTGSEANDAMQDVLLSFMDGRNARFSQADFLTVIAGLELNQTHIGLVGLQQTGIEFVSPTGI